MTDILEVQGTTIRKLERDNEQFICLTDIAQRFGESQLILDWLKNKNTLEFLGVWEKLNNPEFDTNAFNEILSNAGVNRFRLSLKDWKKINGKGIFATTGRYGGTYAQIDIAIEFCSWISPEFKLYLITEIQRLKKLENSEIGFERSVRRIMTKASYRVHTDAVKANLIPPNLEKRKISFIYASEADVLNVALFGMTAKQWRDAHPDSKGNIRDDEELCSVFHLVVLNNLESQNALLIQQGVERTERVRILNKEAIRQMEVLAQTKTLKSFEKPALLHHE